MASGQAPRIDGLSADLFKHFWNIIGPDLHSVLLECFRTGSLPVYCQSAVLSLLPKKGDLALPKAPTHRPDSNQQPTAFI